MNEIRSSNKAVIFFAIVIFIISLIIFTMAFFTPIINEGPTYNTTGTVNPDKPDITFTEINGGINLINTYPMTDEEGMKEEPFTFNVTNNDTKREINYEIVLETNINNNLSDDLISTNMGGILSSLPKVPAITEGYDNGYILESSILPANGKIEKNLYIWINSAGTIENAQNKIWKGKIIIKSFNK